MPNVTPQNTNVTLQELQAVPEREFTETWSPWHHTKIIDTVNTQLSELNIEPVPNSLSMELQGNDGAKLFGSLGLRSTNGREMQLGFRNALDKSFALGFVAGEKIYVCSNMGFYGQYRQVHIHNAQLTEERLSLFIRDAILSVTDEHKQQEHFIEQLREIQLGMNQFHTLTHAAMQRDIIKPSKFNTFLNGFREELRDQRDYGHEMTALHFHGAVTRYLRSTNMRLTMQRSMWLDDFLKERVIDGELTLENDLELIEA